jgi:hypothetical protein
MSPRTTLDEPSRCALCSKPLSSPQSGDLCRRCELTIRGADSLEQGFRVLSYCAGGLALRALGRGEQGKATRLAAQAAHLAHLGGVDGLMTLGFRISRILDTYEQIADEPRFVRAVKTTTAELAVVAVSRRIHTVLFPEAVWQEL